MTIAFLPFLLTSLSFLLELLIGVKIRPVDEILLASSPKFGQRQLEIKNQPGDLTQTETAKYFSLILICSNPQLIHVRTNELALTKFGRRLLHLYRLSPEKRDGSRDHNFSDHMIAESGIAKYRLAGMCRRSRSSSLLIY